MGETLAQDPPRMPHPRLAAAPGSDATTRGREDEVADLPAWDLTDLYPSPDSPTLEADFARAEADAKGFAARYPERAPPRGRPRSR